MIDSIAMLRESAAERGEDWSGLEAAERRAAAYVDGVDAALAWNYHKINWLEVKSLAPAEGQPEREQFFKGFADQHSAMSGR